MGLFRRRTEERAEGFVEFEDNLLKALLSGEVITKEKALQIPAVSGGIDLISNVVVSTPIKLYKEIDGRTEEIRDDPRIKLLNDDPGDTLNANEFWRAMIRDYYTGKGGYAYINRVRGRVKGLYYVDESRITINKGTDPIYKDFDLLVEGESYKPYDFLKILRNTRDGASGVSIIEESSLLLGVAYSTLVFEQGLVKRGGNKKGFLRSEKRLEKESLDALRVAFNRLYSDSSENFVVLNNGVDFKDSSSTSVEMQLNENKQTNAREFSRLFHIPVEVMEGKGSDEDMASLAKLAAIPLMTVIQCALNRDFLLEREKSTMYWAFDTKELLKGTMKDRFTAYKTALDANFMQIDEVRYAEDLEPLGLNWIKLGLQDVLYDPQQKTVYTPNTNKLSAVGAEAAAPEGEENAN